MEKLYILDAVNYLFRSYYAIGPMTNKAGESTSALYGFIRSIQKLIKEFSPTHLVAVFDGPDNKKSRQEMFADYKMHRKGAPEDLYPQFNLAFRFCEMAGIPALCIPGVEADDTMASIASWAEKEKATTFLCTSDKDLCQLVSDHTFVLNVHKENLLFDAKKVEEVYGVPPHQILDLLAIMGDASDNIPGIEGFGPKTGVALLKELGTLENILAHPEKVPGKKKQETLIAQKDRAILSKKLATLDLSVEVPKDPSRYALKSPDISSLHSFYQEMNFLSLLKDLETPQQKEEALTEPKEDLDYILIDDEKSLEKALILLSTKKELCLDMETTFSTPLEAEIVGVGLGYREKKAFYLPFNGNLGKEKALKGLQQLFSKREISFFGHNFKFDLHLLCNYNFPLPKLSFDTLIASYLLNPENRRHNLDQLSLEKLNRTKISIKDLVGEKKKTPMEEVPLHAIKDYCCEDVDFTCRLKELFSQELKTRDLEKLFYEIELPLLPILLKMERKGIYLNREKLEEMEKALDLEIQKVEEKIYVEVGEHFNLNSPKQLSEILYVKLGLTPPGRKKTETSTNASVLEALAEKAPIARDILTYRQLQKLHSTYVKALPLQINPHTHRIHCTFSQSTAATGRLSCQNPNLQNIPIRTEEGRKIREGFQPEKPDWSYLSFDYSQIELRLLAHLSEDATLIEAFHKGQDIHAHTASVVFNVPLNEVTKEMRYQAKSVNFGILYGQGAYGLSQEIGISMKEAAQFIETYFARYPSISSYLEKSKKQAQKTEVATTLLGRQRPIPEILSKNPSLRAAAERLAINTPLQGTAADIIKIAMIAIDQEISKQNLEGFLLLQIHDELLFEVPDKEIPIFSCLVKEKMENALLLKVPLPVEMKVGKNWGEC